MSALARAVDGRAVAFGAVVVLAFAVPAALLAHSLDEKGKIDDDSAWLLVLFLIILVAMVGGGYVAASRRADAPLVNGALAAVLAYGVVQAATAVRLVADDDAVAWAAIPLFTLLAAAAGMAGGILADHRGRAPRRR